MWHTSGRRREFFPIAANSLPVASNRGRTLSKNPAEKQATHDGTGLACGGRGGPSPMQELLAALESTTFADWLRQSPSVWAYPTVLTLHTLGLAVLVGANWIVDLRVLGVAKSIPLRVLERAFPVMWVGFWVNAVSGAMLFAAEATSKGTTILFLSKLVLVAVGVVLILMLKRNLYGRGPERASVGGAAKLLAAASLALWVGAIAAGRFMAYV
jgi:hypothetical protein